jgi:hypothetical protein
MFVIRNFSAGETPNDASTLPDTEEAETQNVTHPQELSSTEMVE